MDKVLIITGGTHGIGKTIVEQYLNQDFKVFSISRGKSEDKSNLEQIKFDLSKVDGIEEVINEIFLKINKTSIEKITLINNAARLGDICKIEDGNINTLKETAELNIVAPLLLSSLFIKNTQNMKVQKSILNISSGAAVNPYYGWTAYCTTKAGLDMMTKTIALEQESLENGVKVLSVYPGVVDTNMQANIRQTDKKDFKDLQRFLDLKNTNSLSNPKVVAEQIYKIDHSNNIKNGSIIDVRKI